MLEKLYYYSEGGMGDVILQYYNNKYLSGLAEHKRQHEA